MESKQKMAKKTRPRLLRRLQRLTGGLGRREWLLQGTIRLRKIIRARRGQGEKTYGPYYQWTFKESGKTVTVNLSAAQLGAFRRAIKRQRQVEKLLAEMRQLSRQFLEATTQGVVRRKTNG